MLIANIFQYRRSFYDLRSSRYKNIIVKMQKYSPSLHNMHNIVVWKYELYLQSKQISRVPYKTNCTAFLEPSQQLF